MRIVLTPITESDGEKIVKWRNDPKVRSHCLDKTPVTIESNRAFYNNYVLTGKYKQFIVDCMEETTGVCSYPIATVYLKDMDYGNKRCELCIFTSSDVEWNQEGQIIAIEMLTKKAFEEYGMHKVYSYVYAKFADEVSLLVNAGFTKEAVLLKESLNDDGTYEDLVRLCVFSNQDI